ncbi:MAG: hypothetical protein H5T63_06240 [Chloroflexi bacterium]|nr:hypothetical protein [Chloroflexota bacterium]
MAICSQCDTQTLLRTSLKDITADRYIYPGVPFLARPPSPLVLMAQANPLQRR